ncbi:hypothetical protein STM14_1933 [Salmonella enterica subsp. enterica serovar Typhimurium str. 14028S]|uniref:Uncharacterized protein n=1 Tax=Salmonella typhimurium (strain 14028s / SGSC 2262) TaxID=588858 RepID=A0A0F6B1L8_SALT1|nr:hypothetical protein STM14_1933 [Salmonella enterica subsp. enterica serovar Typhimurium str. 14028S]
MRCSTFEYLLRMLAGRSPSPPTPAYFFTIFLNSK